MKKIFWRVFISFGVVLAFFTVLIGLMFTRFNRTNIVGAYKQQLGDLASGVAKRTSQSVKNGNSDSFEDYLRAIDDFGNMQNIDIWIVSNPESDTPLDDDYTNMNIEAVDVPEETKEILQSAYNGKKKSYSDYDAIYHATMLHLAVAIRDNNGDVIGAVVVTGPMEMQENTIIQYEKYMLICVTFGLLLALLLAIFFSRQLVRPIIRIKETALTMAAGQYSQKTGIVRKDELGQLAESMDTLSERLVEAEEYREAVEQNRRDFFSNVSHELRTPIAVVKGYADTMADGYVEDDEKRKEYLKRIQNECGSMEKLVSDLLILSRMQNPDYELNMEVLNVIAVAQDAMRSMRILMAEKGLTGSVTYEDECSLIDGDYDRIRQLFVILLQNAVKYSFEGTEIHVHISRKDGWIISTVRDMGSVIPESEWENIFEKFYRASNHGGKEGSGLGLVVAKHITGRHGGKISVESSEEEGTCFTVSFMETSSKNF
jgi:signal transduction histidine kinase